MKKESKDNIIVYESDNFDEISDLVQDILVYPFDKDMLNLLKRENKLLQKYYYIRKDDKYAFFIMYENKMNIFTFGKLRLFFKLKIIGYPCSLSNCGYLTNDENMMFDYIKTMKGAKLVLNVKNRNKIEQMVVGETLPTCILKDDFKNIDNYINSLRSSYRHRIKKAINNCHEIDIKIIQDDSIDVYNLYLNTYNKSNYKLEKLEKGFFDNVDATKIVFCKKNISVGFVLLKKNKKKLIFMLCGMDYNYDTTDLYYFMLYNIISFAIDNKCNEIDFGQTSEETKMKLGAVLEKRYFYAHHSNKILNILAQLGKGLLEYKYQFPKYRTFKEE